MANSGGLPAQVGPRDALDQREVGVRLLVRPAEVDGVEQAQALFPRDLAGS